MSESGEPQLSSEPSGDGLPSAPTEQGGDTESGPTAEPKQGEGAEVASGESPPGGGTEVGTPGEVANPGAPMDCSSTDDVEGSVLRRLSRLEYQLTVKELFQLEEIPKVASIPEDSDYKGFRTLAALQNVTTEHLRSYAEEAHALVDQLLADPPRAAAVIGCELGAASCLSGFVERFGYLAYRRALSEEEVSSLVSRAEELGGSPEEQFDFAVSALLSSASFLFRVEIGDSPEGLSNLSGQELVSKLSFGLIGRSPSGDLLDRAAAGEFETQEGLARAVGELLSDSRSREFFGEFFKQWLGFERMRAPNEPPEGWNDSIMLSMVEETDRFMSEYAWSPDANFLDFLTANHTYIRADLAEFYGLPAPSANGRVEFPEGHDRFGSGILTHASVISAKGDGDKVAHRGAWVQRTFLCRELEVPTDLLASIQDEISGLTYQEMLDHRNTEPACSGCHALIDPVGVGFSVYDSTGKFDSEADASQFGITPAFPSAGEFSNLGELSGMLRARSELAGCLTDRLFLYTGGRVAGGADACAVSRATDQFVADQNRFASALEGMVLAPQFRLRRAPEPQE